ncbi:hypothetical protein, partial [Methanobacterium petrolearium]
QNQQTTQNTNNTQQQLIQQAQKQEQQEKEQLMQKFRQENKKTTAKGSEEENIYKRALAREESEDADIWELYLTKKPEEDSESVNQLEEPDDVDDEMGGDMLESEPLEIKEVKRETEELETVQTVETIDKTSETVDRSALLAKYNIQDVQEDDVDHILENFDKPIINESIDKIEERIVLSIKNSALSHPKIQWVNVLVLLDEEELEGNIKIFAEYVERGLFNRIRSEDNERLKVELMQIALYEVWDIFTTLGVNTDYLESKIEVEVELDRA